jgi:hypothetical protein
MGIFAPLAMATTDAVSAAYASQEGASDNGEQSELSTPDERVSSQEGASDNGEQSELSTPEERSESALAKIIIDKTGNLGPQDKGDFEAEVTGNHPSPTPINLGGDESTRTVTIRPGSYNVHEIGESDGRLDDPDYDVSYSDDCSGTIKPRTTVSCTITNDFTGSS